MLPGLTSQRSMEFIRCLFVRKAGIGADAEYGGGIPFAAFFGGDAGGVEDLRNLGIGLLQGWL